MARKQINIKSGYDQSPISFGFDIPDTGHYASGAQPGGQWMAKQRTNRDTDALQYYSVDGEPQPIWVPAGASPPDLGDDVVWRWGAAPPEMVQEFGFSAEGIPNYLKDLGIDWSRFGPDDKNQPWFQDLMRQYVTAQNVDAQKNPHYGENVLTGLAKDAAPFAGIVGGMIGAGGLINGLSGLGAGAGGAAPGIGGAIPGAAEGLGGYGFSLGGNSIAAGVPGAFSAAIPANLAALASMGPAAAGAGAGLPNIPTGLPGGGGEAALPQFNPNDVMGVDYGAQGGGIGVTGTGGVQGTIPTGIPGSVLNGAQSAAQQSALQRILNGSGTAADYLSLAGTVGSTALGMYQSSQQADQLNDLANKYMEFGAPSRARYEGSYAPGFTMANEPGYKDALDTTWSSMLSRGSMGGNPTVNPGWMIEANKQVNQGLAFPALQNYRNQNAATGGYGAFNTAAPGASQAAAGADNAWMGVLARGVQSATNPPDKPTNITGNQIMDYLRKAGLV